MVITARRARLIADGEAIGPQMSSLWESIKSRAALGKTGLITGVHHLAHPLLWNGVSTPNWLKAKKILEDAGYKVTRTWSGENGVSCTIIEW